MDYKLTRSLIIAAVVGLMSVTCSGASPDETPTGIPETLDASDAVPTLPSIESSPDTEPLSSPLQQPELSGPTFSPLDVRKEEPVLSSPLPGPLLTVPAVSVPNLVPPSLGLTIQERAMADLAERLGLAPTDVELLEVIYDDFPAGDLGCASSKETQPSQPAMVMGQEMIFAVDEREYRYRSHGGTLLFCGLR